HPARFVMMHLIADDDPGLMILPLNRLVRGVGARAVSELVDRLGGDFEVTRLDGQTSDDLDTALGRLRAGGEHGQAVLLGPAEGSALVLLTLPAGAALPAAGPSDRDPSWQTLDVVLVDSTIIRPLLASQSLHAENAIDYVQDAHETVQQAERGETGDVAV